MKICDPLGTVTFIAVELTVDPADGCLSSICLKVGLSTSGRDLTPSSDGERHGKLYSEEAVCEWSCVTCGVIGESRIGYRSTDPVLGCTACGVSKVISYPREHLDSDTECHTVIGELSEAVGLPIPEGPGGVPTDLTEGDLYGTTGSSSLPVCCSVV